MVTNVAVFLYSLTTFQFAFAYYRASESIDFVSGVRGLVLGALLWAIGAIVGSKRGPKVRWGATLAMALGACLWPWVGGGFPGEILASIVMFGSGLLIPSLITAHGTNTTLMRDGYAKLLIGGGIGSFIGAGVELLLGTGAVFVAAGAFAMFAPALEPAIYFSDAKKRLALIVVPLALLALVGIAPNKWTHSRSESEVVSGPTLGNEVVFVAPEGRKLDVFIVGSNVVEHIQSISPDLLKANVRSITAVEENDQYRESAKSFNAPDGIEFRFEVGDGRRRLRADNRRFDVIQILESNPSRGPVRPLEGGITVETIRFYVDRLKEEGRLHLVRPALGQRAHSSLATVAEAWKKMAKPNVDLHVLAVGKTNETMSLDTLIVRLKPFMREERDKVGTLLKVVPGENSWILASDGSGPVLTDDRPGFETEVAQPIESRIALWIAILMFIGLSAWVVSQERRKEVESKWLTLSVATYFGGLGISFAFFQVFFVMRAMRVWGMPTVSMALVMGTILISMAAGATVFAGHPKRRYGVRIQPLANFVFAVLFSYLGAALFQPLVAASSEMIAAFVGMSMLLPFGILGGSFFPNALEEASEKLPPRVISVLWALYATGTALGLYFASVMGLENGLDVVFLGGLFCFAWVAIASGLVRPWIVRKQSAGKPAT